MSDADRLREAARCPHHMNVGTERQCDRPEGHDGWCLYGDIEFWPETDCRFDCGCPRPRAFADAVLGADR